MDFSHQSCSEQNLNAKNKSTIIFFDSTILLMESWGRENICFVTITKSKQGNEQTRSFEPTNQSADYWPATHSYNFIISVK